VRELSGSCPGIRFRFGDFIVIADGATRFDDVSCESIRSGMRVEVRGMLMSDGTVRAERIKREGD